MLDPKTNKPRKLVDGIFPAVSPDGARVTFNTVEKHGTTYDRHIAAALNGDQITRDGETPLATGDTVFFLLADVSV